MPFLAPLALLLSLLAIPIILLYMLRLRRKEVLVSSTMLWQKLLRDREANAPWQKLRRNLLLFLQLFILALLVFALARPFFPVPSVVSGNVVILLDASASMQATDLPPSRFAVAQDEVNRLISGLSGNSQMTLIQVGRTPEVLIAASGDRSALREAVALAESEPAEADWQAALALAAGAVQGFSNAQIVLISDGNLPPGLPPLPAEFTYLPIGESGENLALTALATREGEDGVQLFARVENVGVLNQSTLLSVELDGTLFDSRRLTVPAGGSASATWDLPGETAVIHATLSDSDSDFLPTDNEAWAVHEAGLSNRVLIVSEGNLFLEQVFNVLPNMEAFKAPPETDLTEEAFDLVVFDGVPLPETLPAGQLLIINPQPGSELFSVSGTFTQTAAINVAASPLLQFVEWGNISLRQATAVSAPWGQPLIEAASGPLLLVGETEGKRIGMLNFDLRDSDLPLQIAFPVLMANITSWLNPGQAFAAPPRLQPSDPVSLSPTASTTAMFITKPDGTQWQADDVETAVLFPETDQLGIYQIVLREAGGDRPAGQFAVNLFSPNESAILPAEAVQIGERDVEVAEEGNVGQLEIWSWLAALAILVLMIEWWIHFRGATWPNWRGIFQILQSRS